MSLSISNFISKIPNNGARSSLFRVTLTDFKGSPSSTGIIKDAKSLMSFHCKGVSIPQTQIGTVTVNYLGRPIKYPGNKQFDDLTTTIISDEGHAVRNNIESWMDKMQRHSSINRAAAFDTKSQYVSDMSVTSLTKVGDDDQVYTFKNCFPVGLDEVALAWDTNDSIMEFTVTWSYDWWEHTTAFTA